MTRARGGVATPTAETIVLAHTLRAVRTAVSVVTDALTILATTILTRTTLDLFAIFANETGITRAHGFSGGEADALSVAVALEFALFESATIVA